MSAPLTRTTAAGQQQQSLLDRLIDSQLDWRQLVREANGDGRDFQLGLARLSELQIKRQEVIHELVQTERHHCLTLALMRQVYLAGLRRLNESRAAAHPRNQPAPPHMSAQDSHSLRSISSDFVSFGSASSQLTTTTNAQPGNSCDLIDLDRLFPALEDLIAAHELFFAHLKLRLLDSCAPDRRPDRPFLGFVGPLGALLLDQFRLRPAPADASAAPAGSASVAGGGQTEPTNGQKLLQAYGKFCGSHFDSSKYYKQLIQADKGFRQFIESCNKQNAACRQRGIPECNLLVTQRLTKYPLLLEQLIKTSKDEPLEEQERLAGALRECKCLLAELNQQLARKESFERLLDIYAHFCPKSFTTHNRHLKFTKHDLLQHKRLRQLIHSDGQVRIWSATRRKLFQVLCLILNDIIVFLRFEPSGQSANLTSELGSTPTADASQMAVELCAAPVAPSGAPTANNQQQQPELQQQQQHQTSSASAFRYYFANIDNKSSVISLSKLLVREKAAHDTEPRVYLISSDPRQPEMYELAFVSKRHQAGFVEKLKNCIEQHNRRVASMDELEFVDHLADNIHHQAAPFRFAVGRRLALGHDTAPDEDDDELVELNLEDCECCAACSNPDEDADENVSENEDVEDGDEDESDAERRPALGAQVVAYAAAAALIEAARRGSPSRANCRSTKSKSLRQKKQQEQQRRRDTIGGGQLEIYELDIEQDVVSAGPPCSAAAAAAAGAKATAASSLDGERPHGKSSSPREILDAPPETVEINVESELTKQEDDDDDADENPADSGLSERAKDSLDEASTAPAPTDASSAGKQKRTVRGANRRRRAQRPRNVSNQSSSSSEAAHRQAIELISVCKQLQNEVGGQEDRRNDGDEDDDEFDSGRGHDCSSSSTSGSSSLSSPSQSRAATNKVTGSAAAAADSPPARSLTPSAPDSAAGSPRAPAPTSSQQVSSATARSNPSSSSSSSSSSASSSSSSCSSPRNSSAVGGAAERLGAASKSATAPPATESSADETPAALVKPVCIKSCCCGSFSKQRKLSNVSSVSSSSGAGQLKLISRLKANFDSAQSRRLDESADGESPLSCRLARQVSSSASTKSCCRLGQQPPLQQQMLLLCHHQQQQQQQRRRAQAYASGSHCNDDEALSKQMRQQMRRLSFVPEQKLEELRDLRIQLDKDKQEWQAKFNRMQEQLLNERRELDLAREQLKQDRQQVASEREQLYRKLDALKEKGILLSPSHKVIITAPEQVASAAAAGATCYVGPAAAQAHFSGQPSPPTAHLLRPSSVCLRSANTTTNSIRIHHQPPQQQQQQQQHPQQQLNAADMMSPPLTFATANQVSTTNLFIPGSSTSSRVPLHLSENAAPPGGAQPKQTTLSKVTTPLISVIGCNLFNGVERFTGSTPVNTKSASNNHHQQQQQHHLESRVI